VVEFFRATAEYQGNVAAATRLAIACLPGIPDFERLNGWTNDLRDGGALEDVAADCAGEPEFRSRYDALSNTAFVQQSFQDVIGRSPTPSGLQFWTGRLAAEAPRSSLLLALAESAEHRALIAHEAFVQELFLTLLRRSPTPAELVSRVAQLDGGAAPLEIVSELQAQAAYRARFLP
jgi:hypothetical protein